MELMQVKGNTWCLSAMGVLIPVYRMDEKRCILFDSGFAKERGALEEIFKRAGLTPVGVLGSHDHIDHVGNHAWLKEKYGVQICMPAGGSFWNNETAKLEMYGEPVPKELSVFTDCAQFDAEQVIGPENGEVEFLGVPFQIYHAPGHTPDHICVGTPDGVCYLADLMMVGEMLEKARLPYQHTLSQVRKDIEKMKTVEGYDTYIAAHKGILTDFQAAAEKNFALMDWTSQQILDILEEPLTWPVLVERALKENNLIVKDPVQAVAYQGLVQTYVEDLKLKGQIHMVENEKGCWFQRT